MNPSEIYSAMVQKNRELAVKVGELQDLSEKVAQAERDFNVAYAQKVLELVDSGTAISVAKEVAKGSDKVAKPKYQQRVSEGVQDACKKSIAAINTHIETYRSWLSWKKVEYEKAGV